MILFQPSHTWSSHSWGNCGAGSAPTFQNGLSRNPKSKPSWPCKRPSGKSNSSEKDPTEEQAGRFTNSKLVTYPLAQKTSLRVSRLPARGRWSKRAPTRPTTLRNLSSPRDPLLASLSSWISSGRSSHRSGWSLSEPASRKWKTLKTSSIVKICALKSYPYSKSHRVKAEGSMKWGGWRETLVWNSNKSKDKINKCKGK